MKMFDVEYNKRNVGIDLLRAFAIFCVVHRHGQFLLSWWPEWLRLPHGVDIFFVLTGFLIGSTMIKKLNTSSFQQQWSVVWRFWVRTIFRILPCYLILLMVNYLLVSLSVIPGELAFPIWRYVTFSQNFVTPFYGYFWESWSLSVQMFFYLSFPLLIMLLSQRISIKVVIPLLSLVFIVVSYYFRCAILNQNLDSFWWDVTIRKTVLSRIDCIYFGVLMAWLSHYYPEKIKRMSVLLAVLAVLFYGISYVLDGGHNTILGATNYLSIPAVCFALVIPLFSRMGNADSRWGRLVVIVSTLSYSMYLLNILVMQLLNKYMFSFMPNIGVLRYAVFGFITICCAALLYVLVEKPILKIRNKIKI